MTGTNQNFDSQQWAAHIAATKAAARRVTPILAEQAKNNPFRTKQ
jgi:hypothetical protein